MKKINSSLLITGSIFFLSLWSYAMAAPIQQSSFFRDNSVIVYGSQNKSTAKDEAMIAFNLKKQMKSFINMSADTRLNDTAMRRSNLVILSTGRSNNILNFGNYVETNLPIKFNEDNFVFGDKFYSGKKDGISMIYPSPFNRHLS